MKVESRINNNYQYNKNYKIKLISSKNPSDIEKRYLPFFKNKLKEKGFQVVDKYSEADRLLIFTYKGNMILESFTTTINTSGNSKKTKISEEKALTLIHLKLYELVEARPEKLIWEVTLSGENKQINADPTEAFDLLISQYGKNKSFCKKFSNKKNK